MQILPYSSPDPEPNSLAATHTTIDVQAGRGYAPAVPPNALDFSTLLDVFARRWVWILAPIVIALAIGIFKTKTQVPMYQAMAAIDIREQMQDGSEADNIGAVKRIQGLSDRTVGSQMRLLRSINLRAEAIKTLPDDMQRTGFTRGVKVEVDQPDGMDEAIVVKVTAQTAPAAAALANALVEVLRKKRPDGEPQDGNDGTHLHSG